MTDSYLVDDKDPKWHVPDACRCPYCTAWRILGCSGQEGVVAGARRVVTQCDDLRSEVRRLEQQLKALLGGAEDAF